MGINMEKSKIEERKKILTDIIYSKEYKPMKAKELAMLLNVPRENRDELVSVLDILVSEGKVGITKKGKYEKNENSGESLFTGEFTAHSKGFGFVSIEGEEEDIFIPESCVHGAFHKDVVQVAIRRERPTDGSKRREGEVVKVISRGVEEVVGTFQKNKSFGFVIPDNQRLAKDIFVPIERSKGAVTGHKVVVKITNFGEKNKKPEGIVKEIIGHVNDPGTDILSIVRAYDIPTDFSDGVMNQIERIGDTVDPSEYSGRLDIRDWQTVTIDGEDAKDLDDAITITKKGNIYTLGVHIADVSHYVTEESPLDREALKRGTSVYLVDRVIPMLPHKLSNGICSLNEGQDRLALSCIMEIDGSGKVIGHKLAETVINVDRRMSYTNVQKIIEGEDEAVLKEYENLIDMFNMMKELASILRERRMSRGSIDFDFPESKIYLDPKGVPVDIKPYERNTATKIIEDFMLIANETVAEDFFWQELPFVYRIHENPDPEKMITLGLFISNFGYGIKAGAGIEGIHPKELQKLLKRIEGTPEEMLISRLTLRSMKQARYATVSNGHFGLAAQYYCHFTSPIRRYPDLQIHRIIKENLHGGLVEKRVKHYDKILNDVAEQASKTERRADDAERDTEKLKKVQYMSKRIGEVFEGVVSGITNYGMYVELPNTVEGMVHVSSLKDDYYYYNEEKYELVGQDTGNAYKLGQKIKICVLSTDMISRTIDFELYEDEEGGLSDGEGTEEAGSK